MIGIYLQNFLSYVRESPNLKIAHNFMDDDFSSAICHDSNFRFSKKAIK
jgi:hypothetical protein